MIEISKEAWEEARYLCGEHAGGAADTEEVAATLQRHMDETAQADRCLRIAAGGVTKWKERAEAAEARVRELQEHWDGCAGAEATINDLRQQVATAEASKTALIREVEEWSSRYGHTNYALATTVLTSILDKHRGKP